MIKPILLYGDCLYQLTKIKSNCVDLVLSDLPYNITQNTWDSLIDLSSLRLELERICKINAAWVFTASQPFTSTLINEYKDIFKYCWTWNKVNRISGHLNAKKQPLRITEDIVIFYKKQPVYNPQMIEGIPYVATSKGNKSTNYGKQIDVTTTNEGKYYPINLLSINADERGTEGRVHPRSSV